MVTRWRSNKSWNKKQWLLARRPAYHLARSLIRPRHKGWCLLLGRVLKALPMPAKSRLARVQPTESPVVSASLKTPSTQTSNSGSRMKSLRFTISKSSLLVLSRPRHYTRSNNCFYKEANLQPNIGKAAMQWTCRSKRRLKVRWLAVSLRASTIDVIHWCRTSHPTLGVLQHSRPNSRPGRQSLPLPTA